MDVFMVDLQKLYQSRAWQVKHARDIIDYIDKNKSGKKHILLETGYGPSGRAHIGTLLEAVRTFIIAAIIRKLQDRPVIVLSIIDDMDGFRKVPTGLPNQEMLRRHLQQPLHKVPDPFGECESFADSNIAGFIALSEEFGCPVSYMRVSHDNPYTNERLIEASCEGKNLVLVRSSELYKAGAFNNAMILLLQRYQDVLDIITPTLGEERNKTYSHFMPTSRIDGRVLQDEVCGYDANNATVTVLDKGERYDVNVLNGNAKLQWKIDLGMRWGVLDVDYELSGKDICIGTVPISRQISQLISRTEPLTRMHELFLSEDGSKMSKSKGTSLDINSLIRYCGPNVVRHIMMSNPSSAQRMSLDKIPQYIDAYEKDLRSYHENQDVENKVFYSDVCVLGYAPEPARIDVSDIIGMIECMRTDDIESITSRFNINDTESISILKRLNLFYQEHVDKPEFTPIEDWMMPYYMRIIDLLNATCDAEIIQTGLYDIGKDAVNESHCKNLKDWFSSLYKVIFGRDTGPRLGAFFAMQKDKAKEMLELKLKSNENITAN